MTLFFQILLSIFLLLESAYCFGNTNEVIDRIKNIAHNSHSIVGVSAIHIESGKQLSYQGDRSFFMASTVKVPIALAFLKRVDNHQDTLARRVTLKATDGVPGSGVLHNELCHHSAHSFSMRELLKLMLVISDNTASDFVLHEVKGPKAISEKLHAWGYHNIFVNRSILDLYFCASGLNINTITSQQLDHSLHKIKPEKKCQAWKRFEGDKRDSATANDMALLLKDLYTEKLLSSENTQLMLGLMEQCETGRDRIKGLLPACVRVAHKTGTWSIDQEKVLHYSESKKLFRFASDVGIITLPDQKGHIALAIYIKSKAVSNTSRNHVIARISKEIYQYFLKTV